MGGGRGGLRQWISRSTGRGVGGLGGVALVEHIAGGSEGFLCGGKKKIIGLAFALLSVQMTSDL